MAMLALTILAAVASAVPARAPVPAALTEVNPFQALRWSTLSLSVDDHRSDSARLAPGVVAEAELTAAAVVRLRGDFARGCAPRVSRRFRGGDGWLDVPLPVENRAGDLVVSLPPALAPVEGPAAGEDGEPAPLALTLPAGCAPVQVRAFEASQDPDPFAGRRVVEELQELRRAPHSEEELARWLTAAFPHVWQEEAALALALPRLLAGPPAAVAALADGLLEQALATLRTEAPTLIRQRPLSDGNDDQIVPGEEGFWRRLNPDEQVVLPVDGLDCVRLRHRALMQPEAGGTAVWRLEAAFDEDTAHFLLAHAPADPDAPELSTARARILVVPPGARQLRLRAAGSPLLLQVIGTSPKPSLGDLLGRTDAAALLVQARAAGGWAGRLAAARLHPWPRRIDEGAGAPPIPGALLALFQAQRVRDPALAERLLGQAKERLQAARSPLERSAAAALLSLLVRLQAERAVAAGRPAEAASSLQALAAQRPLTDEDAVALLEADAFAAESLSASPQALLVVDGLLARRPLDRALAQARQRAFRGAARWQELSIDPGPHDVSFLDPLPPDTTILSPEHALFSPVSPGAGRTVELPEPPLPGHQPMLSLLALRAPHGPAVLRVLVDGVPHTLAAVGPFERVDLPVRPGRHQVVIGEPRAGTRVYANFTPTDASGARLRRYIQVGPTPLELYNRAVGPGDLLLVAVRVVGPVASPRPAPFELELRGDAMRPVRLRVQPGSLAHDGAGEIDPEQGASAPIEALVPVATANPSFYLSAPPAPAGARFLVHVSARRRYPPATPAGPSAPMREAMSRALARDEANLPAVAAVSRSLGARGEGAGTDFLARAVALSGLDEPTLAREDLVRAIASRTLPPVAHSLALSLWRHLDNVASSAHPATVDGRSAWVYAPGLGFVSEPVPPQAGALERLVDDRAALRGLDADGLRAAVGGGRAADFALLAAARQADRDGDRARAARLWEQLAASRAHAGLFALAGAARLELPADPLNDARAYVDLFEAARLDPHDPLASRLLRRAASRTRVRPIHQVEDSAGAIALPAGSDPLDPGVEAALMPVLPDQPGDLVTADSQLTLSFNLSAPLSLRLSASVRELRPEGARAVGSAPIELGWVKDGQNPQRVACGAPAGATRACRSGTIALAPGAHALVVRLEGGLRPAARVAVEPLSCGGASACGRATFERTAEFLVARSDQPIVVTMMGPTVVQAEVRAPATGSRRSVRLVVRPASGPAPPPTQVSLPGGSPGRSPRLGRLVSVRRDDVSAAAAVVLERGEIYRVEVRPERGAVLCRLSVRDGVGSEAVRPPPVPATLRATGPPPLLPAPDLESPLAARARDGDVAAGWEGFGALAAEVGFRSGLDLPDQAGAVLVRRAALAGLTYRHMIDRLHLTVKVAGELRRWQHGDSSQAGEVEAYFAHPDASWARLLLSGQGATQALAGQRHTAVQGLVMLEPIATLQPSVHLVSKLGLRAHWQPLVDPAGDLRARLDPDIYTAHTQLHPRSLFWEEGIELSPLSNLLVYAGGRATSNADLRLDRPDRLSINTVARSAWGRFLLEANFRWSLYPADADRARALLRRTIALSGLHTFWIGHLHAVTLGLQAARHIDLRLPELSVQLGWEVSNGRRLRDHTPVEDENYFFPQRGPGREAGGLLVGNP